MSKLIRIETTQAPSEMNITWAPTNLCNFKCSYCWPGANEGNFLPTKEVDLAIKNMDHMLTVYGQLGKKNFKINFAGGEPTLWNGLENVIQELNKNHKIYWGIVTNGSRTMRWWKEYGHLFDSVQISHHIVQADIDHTIELCDLLFEQGVKVTARVMMDVLHWDKGIQDIEYMKNHSKHKWFIDVAEVLMDHLPPSDVIPIYSDGRVYSPEQREFLKNQNKRVPGYSWWKKNIKLVREGKIRLSESHAFYDDGTVEPARANYYMNQKLNYFEGWSCNIGLERVYINYDGYIQGSCGQPLFEKYNILDTEFTDKFTLDFKPTTCQIKHCYCGPEMHITKSIVV